MRHFIVVTEQVRLELSVFNLEDLKLALIASWQRVSPPVQEYNWSLRLLAEGLPEQLHSIFGDIYEVRSPGGR